METRELAERIALLLIDRGFLLDEDIGLEFDVGDFEIIKAKNMLCRFYGIAVERWHQVDEESRLALFLTRDYCGPDAPEIISRVFHDPAFKTKRRMKEEERKSEIKGEVRELLERLEGEWGDLLKGGA